MTTLNLLANYKPIVPAIPFHRSPARFKAITAGTRSSKTYSTAREFQKRIWYDRRYLSGRLHYWVVTPNYPLGKVARQTLYESLEEGLIERDLPSRNELYLKGNIFIEFKSAERPETLVAAGLNGLWVDEVARMKPQTWQDSLRERLSDRLGWGLFSTTPLGENWYYEEIWKRCLDTSRPDYAGFHWKTVDNTALPLLRAEVEQARRDMPLKYFRRNYEASFASFAGQVYDEVCGVHIIKPVFPVSWYDVVIAGVDWGYVNPGVILVIGVKFASGQFPESYYSFHEEYKAGLLNKSWVNIGQTLQARYGIQVFIADPSEPAYIEEFNNGGLYCIAGDNDVHAGIQDVATLMHVNQMTGKPRWFVTENCANTIREHRSYVWDEKVDGTKKEEPKKENDHTCDAGRYAIRTYLHRIIAQEPEEVVERSFI